MIQIEEIEATLRNRGYRMIHETLKKRGFQKDAQQPVYLNLTSKNGETALIAHPEADVSTWQNDIPGLQVSNGYYHSSNLRQFPKHMHGGKNPISYGWGLSFNSSQALLSALDRLEGAKTVAPVRGVGAPASSTSPTSLAEGGDTEATTLRRIGHEQFRSALLKHWKSCAVTGLENARLLRASHIRPWADSSPKDKTDPFNGLLLAPNLDAAFDAGLISFDERGQILISSQLSREDAKTLGIHESMRLRSVAPAHLPFLQIHRKEVFIR
jgi:putative restriction endonuclease